jgi:drug/metabolite transporter (DMT)-like permease
MAAPHSPTTGKVGSPAIPTYALVLIAAISILWGLNWPAMKFAVGELSPWTFRVLCVDIAGVALLLAGWLFGEKVLLPRRSIGPIMLLSLFSVVGWHMLTAFGLTYIGGGRAAIIAFTMPVWAMMLSGWVLKEHIGKRQITGMTLGLAGLAALVGPELAELGTVPIGAALILAAALCWACGTVGIKMHQWGVGVQSLSGWQLLIGGIPITATWLIIEPDPDFSRLTIKGLLVLGYVIFVALLFCFSSYNRLVTILPANIAAMSTLAIPVVGVISSALLLGEQIGPLEMVGLVLVLSALSIVLLLPSSTSGRRAASRADADRL